MNNKIVVFIVMTLLIVTTVLPVLGSKNISDIKISEIVKSEPSNNIITNIDLRNEFLIIPDSVEDTIGMYDTYNGDYLGELINGSTIFSTPINSIIGPDGNIYVSDQIADSVFVYDIAGNYLYTYANATDGLNNIRGIDFYGNHLFITSGDDYVAEFDGPHNRLPDFINDGSDPFDIYFLDDGRALVSDIQGSTDNVRLYFSNGTLDTEIFSVNFPQQIQDDNILPGEYLNIAFSGNTITDFDLDGSITETTSFSGGRGIYRLGNGNLLATNSNGVFEIEPGTGAIIEQKWAGGARFIELVSLQSNNILITNLSNKWNFLSLPFNETLELTEFIVKYDDIEYTWSEAIDPVNGPIIDPNVYGWDRVLDMYIPVTNFEPGYGYWIYSYYNCEIWAQNISITTDDLITNLIQTWNIIGIPNVEYVNKTDLIVNYLGSDYTWTEATDPVNGPIVDPNIYGWDRINGMYVPVTDTLDPGYAYWMYAYQDCILRRSL
jgi:hypothetical protein